MFGQTTEYALRAMASLAYRTDQLTPTNFLAEQTKVPPNYLAKVLQILAGADLIVGRRGVGGGYRLSRPPEHIRLLDVINAVTPIQRIETCPLDLKTHGTNLCALHAKLDQAVALLIDHFDGTSLADLIADSGGSRPLCETSPKATLSISAKPKS